MQTMPGAAAAVINLRLQQQPVPAQLYKPGNTHWHIQQLIVHQQPLLPVLGGKTSPSVSVAVEPGTCCIRLRRFEASGMTIAPYKDPQYATSEWLWIVFDNLHALGRVDEHFEFKAKKNRLLGTMELDSQFEVGWHMLSS